MNLTLEGIRAAGGFSGRPVEKEVQWKQGEEEHTATIHVRRISYQTAVGDIGSSRGGDLLASRIAASICDAEGKAIFKPEDVTGEADPERGALDGGLVIALLVAIGEVQNAGKMKA